MMGRCEKHKDEPGPSLGHDCCEAWVRGLCGSPSGDHGPREYGCKCDELREAYAAGRAARWTYVEDGLPEEDEELDGVSVMVLLAAEGSPDGAIAGWYDFVGERWSSTDRLRDCGRVYAWAPLDELPPRREG